MRLSAQFQYVLSTESAGLISPGHRHPTGARLQVALLLLLLLALLLLLLLLRLLVVRLVRLARSALLVRLLVPRPIRCG